MINKKIHPTWYPEAKIFCDGQVICKIGSTKPELQIEIWSGNHPVFTGSHKIMDSAGRISRFKRKYGLNMNQK